MVSNTDVAAYLRVSSLAIALFDVLQTIPGEIRLYSQQTSIRRLSPACILFIMVRYISIAALITSNVGFFGTGFSKHECHHYYLVAPVLKLIATLVSQVIISIRTYAVSRKARWVLVVLVTMFILSLVPEILGNVVRRVMAQNATKNCTSGNLPGAKLAWLHYLAAMLFDAVATGIASWYLFSSSPGITMMSTLTRMMLQEGLFYFLMLTGANILNVILFRNNNLAIQSAATALGQAVTMIFSQKFILNLSDSAYDRNPTRGKESRQTTGNAPRRLSGGRNTFVQSLSRNGGYSSDRSQAVELGIRIEKDVSVTTDTLNPYSASSDKSLDKAFPDPPYGYAFDGPKSRGAV